MAADTSAATGGGTTPRPRWRRHVRVEQITNDRLHPNGQRAQTLVQIMTWRGAVSRVGQDGPEFPDDRLAIRGQHDGIRQIEPMLHHLLCSGD
jgi:hypothetical protein